MDSTFYMTFKQVVRQAHSTSITVSVSLDR